MELMLKIVSPGGVIGPLSCDSVHLTISEDMEGKKGGSYGIRSGHTKALLSLSDGPIEALLEDKIILKGHHSQGFATVEENLVTIVVEQYK